MRTLFAFIGVCLSMQLNAGSFQTIMRKIPYQDARYPGGDVAIKKYLQDSLRYPAVERQNGVEGIVFVNFVVGKTGTVEQAKVHLTLGGSPRLEAEALRLVLAMPKWEPALSKGKPTTSDEMCEVRFELPDSLVRFPNLNLDSTLTGETMPEFMGGARGMVLYMMMTMRYPQMEKEQGKDGTVYVRYTVEKTGQVSEVSVVKGVPGAPGLDLEAMRIVQSFPRHTPGTLGGKPVRVRMTVPIKFVLN